MAITKIDLETIPDYGKFVAKDLQGKDVRCMKEEGGTIFVYAPRQKRKGWRYTQERFLSFGYSMKPERKSDENKLWHRRIERAKKALESSGLWENHLEWLNNLSKMTWKDKTEINEIYWAIPYSEKQNIKSKEDNRKYFGDYVDKYPFIFEDNGNVDTWYLWEESDLKLKAMNFGHSTDCYKRKIAQSISEKKSYSTGRIQVNYDNSFEYNAEKKQAWYSEEYRNCGNGYYYIALDSNIALFVEKD